MRRAVLCGGAVWLLAAFAGCGAGGSTDTQGGSSGANGGTGDEGLGGASGALAGTSGGAGNGGAGTSGGAGNGGASNGGAGNAPTAGGSGASAGNAGDTGGAATSGSGGAGGSVPAGAGGASGQGTPGDPCAGYQKGAPWPRQNRCSSNIGRSDVAGPAAANQLQSFALANTGWAPSIDKSGLLIVPGDGTTALDSKGGVAWHTQPTPGIASHVTPVIGEFGIYVTTDSGTLHALDPSTGLLLWSKSDGSGAVLSSPTLLPSGLLLASYGAGLHALLPDGSEQWQVPNARVLATDSTGNIYFSGAVAAASKISALHEDGAIAWTQPGPCGCELFLGSAATDAGRIFVPDTATGGVVAFASTGAVLWKAHLGLPFVNSPPAIALDGGLLVSFSGSGKSRIVHLDPTSGAVVWTLEFAATITAPAVDALGRIYVGSSDGKVHAISPDGALVWSIAAAAPTAAPPVIAADGSLIAVAPGSIVNIRQ